VDAMLGGGAANAQQRSWGSSAAVDDADVQGSRGSGSGSDEGEQASSRTIAELQVRFETKRAARQAADMAFEAEHGELRQTNAWEDRRAAAHLDQGAWLAELLTESVEIGLGA